MSDECQRYHSRLAELLAVKKQESYASTIAWIRARVSFAILRSALVCLRGSRTRRRTIPNIQETDLELEVSVAWKWFVKDTEYLKLDFFYLITDYFYTTM